MKAIICGAGIVGLALGAAWPRWLGRVTSNAHLGLRNEGYMIDFMGRASTPRSAWACCRG